MSASPTTISTASEKIHAHSTMKDVLDVFPGAQRALFRKYHIGGCSSCSFQATETLAQVCERNGLTKVDEVLAFIRSSHEQDEKVFISPVELSQLRAEGRPVKLLDVRSRQEFEAVRIDGSVLMSQPTMQEALSHWPRGQMLVVIDHQGRTGLDAAAYFAGHGFTEVRCLRGGIDAWSQEIDPKLPRYRLA